MDEITEYPKIVSTKRFHFTFEEHSVGMPCYWSQPLDVKDEGIEHIVIIIHGVLRNADEYFPNMMSAVVHAGYEKKTLVVAPQFLVDDDMARFNLSDEVPYWGGETGEGWKRGDLSISNSDHPRTVSVSAFEVIDRLVEKVADLNIFPNLKRIVIAGHSAGGQYVNRYAAGTCIEQSIPIEISLRFIVANPSTYVYLNDQRRVEETTNTFAIPENAEPDFDDYKYGLKNLNSYMSVVGVDRIRERYPDKDVIYLLGGEDTREAMLEQTPNAFLQGKNRLERGQVYYHYLKHVYGEEIMDKQKIAIVPCVGHDNAAIFKSEVGINSIFS